MLASLGRRLRPGGRLVLDVFDRAFFEAQPAELEREVRPGIVERSRLIGARRYVELDYGDGQVDRFEWQLYRPDELEALACDLGLRSVLTVASGDVPAMQLVLERDA